MSEKEPIGRTAGRYVRAAGIAFKKERARLAAESEAKRAAEAAQAAQVAAQQPAQAPPAVQPPPAAAALPPAAAAPAPPRRGHEPPPPNRFLDRVFWIGFLMTIAATCLVLLSIDTVLSGTTKTVFRLVLGGICFTFSAVVLSNWQHAKDRVLATMARKLWGVGEPRTRMGRFARSVAKDVLTLLGIVWLAVGVLDILRVLLN